EDDSYEEVWSEVIHIPQIHNGQRGGPEQREDSGDGGARAEGRIGELPYLQRLGCGGRRRCSGDETQKWKASTRGWRVGFSRMLRKRSKREGPQE
ncbi:unnamed protein product, partial [Ilex paraguariensis]